MKHKLLSKPRVQLVLLVRYNYVIHVFSETPPILFLVSDVLFHIQGSNETGKSGSIASLFEKEPSPFEIKGNRKSCAFFFRPVF